jgi:hypothetical protein
MNRHRDGMWPFQGHARSGEWRARGILAAAAFAALLLSAPVQPRAQQPQALPTDPMLRIDPNGHTARIWRIAIDSAERFAATASDDKTVRVWSLPDGKLQRVLRLPSNQGDVGISKYRDKGFAEKFPLRYAGKDAADFIAAVKAQEAGLYSQVVTYVPGESLRDEAATRDAILDGLDWIKRSVTSLDVAMVIISGHGLKSPDQRYRLLPHDYDPARMERTTITDAELQQYLANIAGKTLFFFDTCYSAGVVGGKSGEFHPDVDRFANELRASENGVVVFASSTGNQVSHEHDDWKNGAFTKALVEGLGGRAARPQAHAISISDLEGYVSRRVHELTKGNQTPMTAKPKTVQDFWIAAVRQ